MSVSDAAYHFVGRNTDKIFLRNFWLRLQVITLHESGRRVPKAESGLQQSRDTRCVAVVKALTQLNVGSGADIQTFLEGLT